MPVIGKPAQSFFFDKRPSPLPPGAQPARRVARARAALRRRPRRRAARARRAPARLLGRELPRTRAAGRDPARRARVGPGDAQAPRARAQRRRRPRRGAARLGRRLSRAARGLQHLAARLRQVHAAALAAGRRPRAQGQGRMIAVAPPARAVALWTSGHRVHARRARARACEVCVCVWSKYRLYFKPKSAAPARTETTVPGAVLVSKTTTTTTTPHLAHTTGSRSQSFPQNEWRGLLRRRSSVAAPYTMPSADDAAATDALQRLKYFRGRGTHPGTWGRCPARRSRGSRARGRGWRRSHWACPACCVRTRRGAQAPAVQRAQRELQSWRWVKLHQRQLREPWGGSKGARSHPPGSRRFLR